ncbi:hypothetical protein [Streptomyces broussonetiae]|nr:hypothetical protein [Streptomyces broussonetiae]
MNSDVRPLGDGTWLTYDTKDGTLNRWARMGPAAPRVPGGRD